MQRRKCWCKCKKKKNKQMFWQKSDGSVQKMRFFALFCTILRYFSPGFTVFYSIPLCRSAGRQRDRTALLLWHRVFFDWLDTWLKPNE